MTTIKFPDISGCSREVVTLLSMSTKVQLSASRPSCILQSRMVVTVCCEVFMALVSCGFSVICNCLHLCTVSVAL